MTLAGRLELLVEEHQGRLVVRAFVDGRELRLDRPLVDALAELVRGAPTAAARDVLLTRGLFVARAAPPAFSGARAFLAPATAIDVIAGRRGRATPSTTWPIALFVPPDRLAPLERLAADLRDAWLRMLGAAQSRGRTLELDVAERVLSDLARERHARDPELAAIVDLDEDPLRLTPRGPLVADSLQYPIEELRFHRDRSAPDALHFRAPAAALPELGRALGLLGRGAAPEELAGLGPDARRLVASLLLEGLCSAETPPAMATPPGTALHLGHATLLANLGGAHILVDPWLPPASRADAEPPPAASALPPLAAIFLSHHHWDHLNPETLLKLDKGTPIYVPRQPAIALAPQSARLLAAFGFSDVREWSAGDAVDVGDGGRVRATPFYGEDPTRIGWAGVTFALEHRGSAALVLVDSGSAGDAPLGQFPTVFATRRQEMGSMIEHTFEFVLVPAPAWVRPTENCCNGAAFLGRLCARARARRLVLYSEGGADWYPEGTDFLRRTTPSAVAAAYQYGWDDLPAIEAAARAAGAEVHLARPGERFAFGGDA